MARALALSSAHTSPLTCARAVVALPVLALLQTDLFLALLPALPLAALLPTAAALGLGMLQTTPKNAHFTH